MKNHAIARALLTVAAVLSAAALILAAVLILNAGPGLPSTAEDGPAGSSSVFSVTDAARGLVNMHPALLRDAS